MTLPDLEKAALDLSAKERIALADHLWRSVELDGVAPVSEEERRLLDQRLTEHEADPGDVVSWDTVKADLWPNL